jgi:hypothetical protein
MCIHCEELEERLKDLKERHYDPEFGDGRECECGHAYYRHFDTYDEMYPNGCKYCKCRTFKEVVKSLR